MRVKTHTVQFKSGTGELDTYLCYKCDKCGTAGGILIKPGTTELAEDQKACHCEREVTIGE